MKDGLHFTMCKQSGFVTHRRRQVAADTAAMRFETVRRVDTHDEGFHPRPIPLGLTRKPVRIERTDMLAGIVAHVVVTNIRMPQRHVMARRGANTIEAPGDFKHPFHHPLRREIGPELLFIEIVKRKALLVRPIADVPRLQFLPGELLQLGIFPLVERNGFRLQVRQELHGSRAGLRHPVMQDVIVGSGETLPKGAKVTGHVIEAVVPGNRSDESKISFQFDQVLLGNQNHSITTNLRAVASKYAVRAAASQSTSNENTESQVQIGGDQISYGEDGLVLVGSQVVGKYTSQGVLAYGGQDLGTPCRGTIDDRDHPQAFWLFSVNACGAYGFGDLTVFHAGRTTPIGEVTLSSKSKVLKVDKGSGMLLLVGGGSEQAQVDTTPSRGTGQ